MGSPGVRRLAVLRRLELGRGRSGGEVSESESEEDDEEEAEAGDGGRGAVIEIGIMDFYIGGGEGIASSKKNYGQLLQEVVKVEIGGD